MVQIPHFKQKKNMYRVSIVGLDRQIIPNIYSILDHHPPISDCWLADDGSLLVAFGCISSSTFVAFFKKNKHCQS